MTGFQARRSVQAVALTVLACLLAGCGGGGGSSPTTTATQNVQQVTVDAGPTNNGVNVGFISVTICAPGTGNCQTIDHIDVDTGSSGLRIISSVLSPSLGLTQQTDASGRPVAECTAFADGFVWGPVKLADLTIAGEQAKSLPIQVINDPSYPNVPGDCSGSGGPNEGTVSTFGANGIIGIGNFQADCGSVCADQAIPAAYYVCPSSGCVNAAAATATQVQNPVGLFATDNNGALLQLPGVSTNGAATLTGSLIFGIGTQTNNGLGRATVLNVDPNTGFLSAVIGGIQYPDSFVDSGSSAYFLPQSFAPACTDPNFSGYLCPPAPLNFSATVQGINGAGAAASFSVTSAETLLNAEPTFTAFDNLAAINPDDSGIDLGLPFFYGRSIYTAIENKQTPVGNGPFVAF